MSPSLVITTLPLHNLPNLPESIPQSVFYSVRWKGRGGGGGDIEKWTDRDISLGRREEGWTDRGISLGKRKEGGGLIEVSV